MRVKVPNVPNFIKIAILASIFSAATILTSWTVGRHHTGAWLCQFSLASWLWRRGLQRRARGRYSRQHQRLDMLCKFGGYQTPQSLRLHENCGLASIFLLPSARLCTDHAEISHDQYTMGLLLHATFEPNRWLGRRLYRCPKISIFGEILSFSLLLLSQPAKCAKN